MSYDPYRTNMLPDMGTSYPITEELPAVGGPGGRGSGPTSRFLLAVLTVVLVAAIAAIAAILVIDNQRSDDVATGDDDATVTPIPDSTDPSPAPTVPDIESGEAAYWQVVDVPDGLNVRSGPGTDNEVVGSLTAGARHVLGTGRTANVGGGQWTEIRYDAADRVGWVSARFLTADTAPSEDDPTPTATATPAPSGDVSQVCFRNDDSADGPVQVARLEFTDRTSISGLLRTVGAETTTDQTVEGTLDSGRADITLTDVDTDARSRQTWTFNPADVELGDGRKLTVVDCRLVAGQLG